VKPHEQWESGMRCLAGIPKAQHKSMLYSSLSGLLQALDHIVTLVSIPSMHRMNPPRVHYSITI
jgi:hypothetical protein